MVIHYTKMTEKKNNLRKEFLLFYECGYKIQFSSNHPGICTIFYETLSHIFPIIAKDIIETTAHY